MHALIPPAAVTAYRALAEQLDEADTVPCTGRPEWMSDDPAQQQRAALICLHDCPVLLACRAYADSAREPDGVWGGLPRSVRTAKRRSTTQASP